MTIAYDLFAGARGWDVHADDLGLDVIGFELNDDACATARAAGLYTVQADLAALDPERVAAVYGAPEGLIGSPPCQLFSPAGKGTGRKLMAELHRAVTDAAQGASDVELARHRRELRRLLAEYLREETMGYRSTRRARRWRSFEASPVRRADRALEADRMARNVSLVWQPARWAARLRPRWIALEQVPPVLPLWQAMAHALEAQGYRCWAGILSSERYGVPQTRKRAFLLASLDGQPHPPEATHQEYVPGQAAREPEPDLFGPGLLPWVSMAQALGWGGGRYGFPRRDDLGTSPDGYRERDWRDTSEPAGVITEKARSFVYEADPDEIEVELQRGGGLIDRHGERRPRKGSEPAPTIRTGAGGGCGTNLVVRQPNSTKGGTRPEGLERTADAPARTVDTRADQWEVVTNAQPNATTRRADEPAPTIKGGHDTADRRWRFVNGTHEHRAERLDDEPAPTLHFGGRLNTVSWEPEDGEPEPLPSDEAVVEYRRGGERLTESTPVAAPAPAITGRVDRWQVKEPEDRDPERTVLDRRQTGGDGVPVGPRPATAPAPTMTAEGLRGGRDVWRDEDDPEASWARERPATTVAADARVFPPGHKLNDEDVRAGRGGQARSGAGWTDGRPATTVTGTARSEDGGTMRAPSRDRPERGGDAAAVRVTEAEAAILQSFPASWPWQGNRTSVFQQIGNAVPPLMARRVLEAVATPTRRSAAS